jgi:Flp pilus assembly pilin Flp
MRKQITSKFIRKETGGHLMGQLILRFLKNNSGVTAIEYALCTAGITFVIIAGSNAISASLIGIFTALNAGF